jgi:two-component system, NtrC family, sensor kinase
LTRGAGIRVLLLAQLAAIAAAVSAVLLAAGLPLLARGRSGVQPYVLLVAVAAALVVALGAALLFRSVARPLDRLFAAAEQLSGPPGELPVVAGGGGGLDAAAAAFSRVAAALAEERARLAAKIEELSAANAVLADTRESLLRSERLATVGRLASGVAHEVGNPLGAITGYADLAVARLPPDAAEARDFLARIAAEARRIDAIVRDLLDFARPADLRLAPVALGPAIEGAVRLARVQARFKAVAVEVGLPPDLPPVVADERRLSQVLLNLLLNAGDAMGGSGEVRVSAEVQGGAAVLSVADGGPGIAEADLPRIFDPFFTTKPPGHGTGLGLAICHRIVESFGGSISAENAPGGGAVLTIRLRLAGTPAEGRPGGAQAAC